MVNRHLLYSSAAAAGLVVLLAAWPVAGPQAQQSPPPAVSIDADDIGGVVTGRNGPEAGVWVIAETTELGTRFAKMVVTDDLGRYLIPDLPQANYSVWVRGYGLVDSPRVTSHARADREPHRGAGAERESRSGVLPRHLLVLDALDSGPEFFPGYGAERQRDAGRLPDTGTMVERRPVERLRQLPPAGRQGHARDSRGTGHIRQLARCLAQAASCPDRPRPA